jgi:hypothetical protein
MARRGGAALWHGSGLGPLRSAARFAGAAVL